jgi:predicted secreted protein
MSTVPWTATVTDPDGQTVSQSGSITVQNPAPVINSVTITPATAPSGTNRHVVVGATGTTPFTYSLTVGAAQPVVNQTGVFDVVV